MQNFGGTKESIMVDLKVACFSFVSVYDNDYKTKEIQIKLV